MSFVLPKLKYEYNSLKPHIDAKTMEIHYSKHHQAYINNLNVALEKFPELQSWSLEELLKKIQEVPQEIRTTVINNAGGHYNHSLFWELLSPNSSKAPNSNLAEAIDKSFGSYQQFQEKFTSTALSRFGSGWAWLIKTSNGELEIYSTPNQDCPLMEGKYPIIGLDVWEHAYYLNYQNRRADYITAFWNIIDWEFAETRFDT